MLRQKMQSHSLLAHTQTRSSVEFLGGKNLNNARQKPAGKLFSLDSQMAFPETHLVP